MADEVKVIQFINPNINLLLRGLSGTSVYGQVLEIGPDRPGRLMRYMSPEEQVRAYGAQAYMLTGVYDPTDPKKKISHPDLDRRLDGKSGMVPATEAMSDSSGLHRDLNLNVFSVGYQGNDNEEEGDQDDEEQAGLFAADEEDEEEEEEEKPKKSSKAKTSKSSKKSSSKSSSKKSSKSKK